MFSGRTRRLYLALTNGIALTVALASWIGGRWLVQNRYPDLAPDTLEFYHWIALANGCQTVMILMRPVVVKYGRLSMAMLIASATFAVQMIALIALVPIAQAEGAAMGLAIALATGAALWTVMAIRLKPASGEEGGS